MKEAIIRISAKSQDVEILVNNLLIKNDIIEKKLTLERFSQIINDYANKDRSPKDMICKYLEPGVIGYANKNPYKKYIIQQPEHRRYITYSVGKDNQAFEINFPSSIYVIDVKDENITSIQAYMYLRWKGLDTKLYKYAMANMLTDNKICIGNAEKTISNDSIIYSLEKIIYAPYSHATLNNIKGFRNTKTYFEYLNENSIEEKYLYSAQKRLIDLYKG